MKVELIEHTSNPEETVAKAARLCYSDKPTGDIEIKDVGKFVSKLAELGHYSPFEHASFTFAIDGISRACYDDKTEILTTNGWKLFKDLNSNDEVATLNPATHKVEFQRPTNYINYDYVGDLHYYKNQALDLAVSPNHKMYIKKYDVRKDADYELVASENINVNRFYIDITFDIDNEVLDDVVIKGYSYERKLNNGQSYTKTLPDLHFNKNDFVKFLAFYLSEGSTCYEKQNGESYRVTISQYEMPENNETRSLIVNTLKNMGLCPQLEAKAISFKSQVLGRFLKELGVSNKKYIPFNLFSFFNKEYARNFIETYLKFDGNNYKGSKTLYTSSSKLAEQLQIVCSIADISTSLQIIDRVGQEHPINGVPVRHNFLEYRIRLSDKRGRYVVVKKNKHFTTKKYSGKIYCVEVPNHVIYVRRNGIACWCGNCSHQLVRHRIASYSQRSQRYVSEDSFDYIVPESLIGCKDKYEKFMAYTADLYKWLVLNGVPKEDARYILPNATATNIIVTMNARSLMNFFRLRCCNRAHWEIRELADAMYMECMKVAPLLFANAGPACVTGKCTEGKMTCGKPRINDIFGVNGNV